MSFFYLTPVKGDMPIHLLDTIVISRLDFLKSVVKGNGVVYSEYVTEGGVYDNVGHFMLCIIAILGDNTAFTRFILKAEVELFKIRLKALTDHDIRGFAKRLLSSIKKHNYNFLFIEPLKGVCQHFVLKHLAQHICAPHSSNCDQFTIHVNFRHCLPFIARRQVELKNGIASIPCGIWKIYITSLFTQNISHRIKTTDLVTLKSDPRIMKLLIKIKREYFPEISNSSTVLLSSQVDIKSGLFPPCMKHLHLTLRKKHRLSHSQRFYYSLFLKDIGMPIEEAIDFWRGEYRQNPCGSHSCSHHWERDEKKYLYGIRHMYGLEGCRKSYTSVNCARIQAGDNACSEGGCPFKSFDLPKMHSLLNKPSDLFLSQIEELKRTNQHTKLCMLYLQEQHGVNNNLDCDTFSFNFTPVKYFALLSKNIN